MCLRFFSHFYPHLTAGGWGWASSCMTLSCQLELSHDTWSWKNTKAKMISRRLKAKILVHICTHVFYILTACLWVTLNIYSPEVKNLFRSQWKGCCKLLTDQESENMSFELFYSCQILGNHWFYSFHSSIFLPEIPMFYIIIPTDKIIFNLFQNHQH